MDPLAMRLAIPLVWLCLSMIATVLGIVFAERPYNRLSMLGAKSACLAWCALVLVGLSFLIWPVQ